MPNRTIYQIPSTVPVELRRAFSRIIEQIDIIVGNSDRSPYATLEDVAANSDDIDDLNSALDGLSDAVAILTSNPVQEEVSQLLYTVVTRGAGYVQAEAQSVADDVKDNSDKIDELINLLRLANILK